MPTVSRSLAFVHADPPPFERVEAAGRPAVLVVCDHASAVIPARYGDLGLGADVRRSHVAWDIGAAEVARRLAVLLGAPAVLSGVSRLVIDCNRPLGDPGSIPAATCGVAVPGNAAVDGAEARSRADTWFRPYHSAIANSLDRLRRPGRPPAVVSVHSFTPVLAEHPRPWHVGVLWNRDARLAVPLMARLAERPGVVVGDNQPYSGREINYTLDTHAGAAGLPHVSVELRQDLVADAVGAARWAELLAEVLAPLLPVRS